MFEYEFFNTQTGDEWVVTCCNSKEDALEYMREKFPVSFRDWEYVRRYGYSLTI